MTLAKWCLQRGGELSIAEDGDGQAPWIHTDGPRVEEGMPEGSKPEAIIAVANAIKDMGAMTSLNISNNNIGKPDEFPEGWSYGLEEGSSYSYEYKHTDGRKQDNPPAGSKSSGLTAFADAINDMGALIKLDISSNYIGAEQEGDLQRICMASGIELAK